MRNRTRTTEDQKQAPEKAPNRPLNSTTLAAMELSEKGKAMYGPYDSVQDTMKALNED